ncbi:5-(carboxyamino)imidazole ribonucleotide synthase [Sneathiella litorea]|uniref:N5-carboxyaminoimidazole ribonucleotide synthase n=1 Tax=Sneathiella litorea TaxID=2606216 RepID=A0A6L8WAI2_9PROT|nr:5-(carboxyamino)imidazole ribonucleotide synthase [Sneathiella litorea]MZR31985.1 5-(carboxyamino)imidazole ribonucleotide synthase [Sneathiella litorea]
MTTISPGGHIGILGDGQLGRMMAIAAAEMGYFVHIFGPEENSPAAQVSHRSTVASYSDKDALKAFAETVDVVTLEFENIPTDTVRFLNDIVPVRPGAKVLEITQDRLFEKSFINNLGIETAIFANVESMDELIQAIRQIKTPAILKTRRLGYDGKGQVKITESSDLDDVWAGMKNTPSILEGLVNFKMEISVIIARNALGKTAAFCPVENRHKNHILDITLAPADIPDWLTEKAIEIAEKIAIKIDLVGMIAVEMFISQDNQIVVNELAPRPHNSGHWTIEGCATSQFRQIIRAVCGLPLGDPAHHSNAVMTNLIGDDVQRWGALLEDPENNLHLYGKKEAREGRKMGHVTRLLPLNQKPKA